MKIIVSILQVLLWSPVPFMAMANALTPKYAQAGVRLEADNSRMALKGKLLLEEDFKTPAEYTKEFQPAREGWRVRAMHGTWKRSNEGIESTWISDHMPVLAYEGSFRNVVIELEFRFHKEPGKKAVCRISATNPTLDPQAYSVSSWANADSKERALGMVLEHDEWRPQGYTTVANQMAMFNSDKWYSMRLEIIGDDALINCNGITLVGTHEKFGMPKTVIAIGTGHCPHEVRNLRVYEAIANPAWTMPAANSQPYVPVESLPPRLPLAPATVEKIQQMTPLFDGKTLDGWIQAPVAPITIARQDVLDFAGFAKRLGEKSDPVSAFLSNHLDDAGKATLAAALAGNTDQHQTLSPLLKSLNSVLGVGAVLYDEARFKGAVLRPKTKALLQKNPQGPELARLNRLLLEDVYTKELAKSPDASWIVKDGVMASTGACRGVIYSEKDYSHYRLVFQVRQASGDHLPGVLLFCERPPAGELGLDALGGIQFAVPNGSHWDYRPGMNKSGIHFRRPIKIRFNAQEWAQLEILVNAKNGTARMAVAQPVGTRPIENLSFNDPAAGKAGPIALQMHNALLFDEYKDIRIEINPKEDKLITLD